MNDEQKIRMLLDSWMAAIRTREISKILEAHDENIIMFDVPEPFSAIGLEAYKETWVTFFAGTESGQYEMHDLKLTIGADVAFCTARMRCSWRNGNDFENLNFRLTVGLQKKENHWLVVHEHHSVPAAG